MYANLSSLWQNELQWWVSTMHPRYIFAASYRAYSYMVAKATDPILRFGVYWFEFWQVVWILIHMHIWYSKSIPYPMLLSWVFSCFPLDMWEIHHTNDYFHMALSFSILCISVYMVKTLKTWICSKVKSKYCLTYLKKTDRKSVV